MSRKQQMELAHKVRKYIKQVGVCAFALFMICGLYNVAADDYKVVNKVTDVYVICDVVDRYDVPQSNLNVEGETRIYVEMPNGDVEIYSISDAPEGDITECCLKTTTATQDDFTTYEVVTVR